jgi:hypothetical protein
MYQSHEKLFIKRKTVNVSTQSRTKSVKKREHVNTLQQKHHPTQKKSPSTMVEFFKKAVGAITEL